MNTHHALLMNLAKIIEQQWRCSSFFYPNRFSCTL